MHRSLPVALLCAGLVVSSPVVHAQGTLREQTSGRSRESGALPSTVVSINPFLPLAGYFQGEFERRIRSNLAFAIGASHIELDDIYTNVDAKLRLYPQDLAPHGFAVAAGLGFGRIRSDDNYSVCPDPGGFVCEPQSRRTISGPSFSVEAQYQWLLGNSRNTAVAFGGGAKRYYIDEKPEDNFSAFVPTLRLTIGYAFK